MIIIRYYTWHLEIVRLGNIRKTDKEEKRLNYITNYYIIVKL